MNRKRRGITLEELWQQRRDEEVIEAAAHLADYTEEAKQVIMAEIHRRELADPPRETGVIAKQRDDFLSRVWRGQEKLWKVYWLLGLPVWVSVALLEVAVDESIATQTPAPPIGTQLLVFAAYGFWCVSVWRCAKNVEEKVWTFVARLVIVVNVTRTLMESLKLLTQ